ncbi:MAG: MtnX-like HAD-IB family phosphatase [Nitrospirae bacterium]|nr:MtnX-like HAD-IB family phosphatase [Nitrospirota bacterium]
MEKGFFVSIDFDGTVTYADVTDAILKAFAGPGWEEIEDAWQKGLIGSGRCLTGQMALVDATGDELLDFVDSFELRPGFTDFLGTLKALSIPFGIVSDGFEVVIRRILSKTGFDDVPVYANGLTTVKGRMVPVFPNSARGCPSGTCKCKVVDKSGAGLPVIHIGDGRSDFCVAQKASLVFCRGALLSHCESSGILHHPFNDFFDIAKALTKFTPLFRGRKAMAV